MDVHICLVSLYKPPIVITYITFIWFPFYDNLFASQCQDICNAFSYCSSGISRCASISSKVMSLSKSSLPKKARTLCNVALDDSSSSTWFFSVLSIGSETRVLLEGSLGNPNLQVGPFFVHVFEHVWVWTSWMIFLSTGSSGISQVMNFYMSFGTFFYFIFASSFNVAGFHFIIFHPCASINMRCQSCLKLNSVYVIFQFHSLITLIHQNIFDKGLYPLIKNSGNQKCLFLN